jgi:hypothetical protein
VLLRAVEDGALKVETLNTHVVRMLCVGPRRDKHAP